MQLRVNTECTDNIGFHIRVNTVYNNNIHMRVYIVQNNSTHM